MSEFEILNKIAEVRALVLAHKTIMARMLAHVAASSDDPQAVLENISLGTTAHIHETEKQIGEDAGPGTIAISEIIQREADWIVEAARRLME
jgi:hypothetical protein